MTTRLLPLERPLVVGYGVAGRAVATALVDHGVAPSAVRVLDDAPAPVAIDHAHVLGVELVVAPAAAAVDQLTATSTAVLPSPGLPDAHPAMAAAARHGVPVLGELDLVDAWDDRPLVVITGTDGKTTVTTMVTAMYAAAGIPAVDAGNNDLPLVEAIADPTRAVFVVEASSYRLGHTASFRPRVGTWLNFAPDHVDNHGSLDRYEAAKARLFELLPEEGVAVANADDPVVVRHAPRHRRVVTFSLVDPSADYRVEAGVLRAGTTPLVAIDELPRALPHDVANALAAAATAMEGDGAARVPVEAVREVLRTFRGLPHRVELVLEHDGVAWYDDSKATTPHATLTALGGFPSVVLIAGGSDKGADLGVLAAGVDHVRAVVALGATGPQVEAAFAHLRPVERATDMADAVRLAAALARPGDAVLLSPACASFDMFTGYAQRGEVFAAAVRALPALRGARVHRADPATPPSPDREVSES